MYGAIPLSYKGMTTKLHLIPLTNPSLPTTALLFTRLFTVRGLDEGNWTGGSLSSSWGSNTSTSSAGGKLTAAFPFPRMTPIASLKEPPPVPASSPSRGKRTPPTESSPLAQQRAQTAAERFGSGWFPSPSPILNRGPMGGRRTPMKTPSPEHRRRGRGTTMFAIGLIIPVASEGELNALIHGSTYGTLRRAIEELVRDAHEKLETGEYHIDFTKDVNRFLTRIRNGLGVLRKVPLAWRASEDTWKELILSLSKEIDPKYAVSLQLSNSRLLATLMCHVLESLQDQFNTPPASPLHRFSQAHPPPNRLLIISTSETLANRLTAMLLPFYKAVYPPSRHPKRTLPKPPKIHILSAKPPTESPLSSYNSQSSIQQDFTQNVDLPRRATHPTTSHPQSLRSPPILSVSQIPGGGNPSSVTSWFGSWIRRGGPLAATSGTTIESISPDSPQTENPVPRHDSGSVPASPEVDVLKESNGEVIEVKLTSNFATRQPSTTNLHGDYDLRRRGSMALNNVAFTEDVFRVTSFHTLPYHADYHLQSMEPTSDYENDVFRVLKEDILFFFTPPVHATPLNPVATPEMPRYPPGQRTASCIVFNMEAAAVTQLIVRLTEEDEEQQDREPVPSKDDRLWRKVQSWASDIKSTISIDELVKRTLS